VLVEITQSAAAGTGAGSRRVGSNRKQ